MGDRRILAAIGVVAALVFAIAIYFAVTSETVEPPVADAEPETPAETPAPETASSEELPAFDILRFSADGAAVFAGSATPNATVRIFVDGKLEVEAVAGADGTWAAVAELSTAAGEHVVTLEEITPSGVVRKGADPLVVLIPERSGDPVIAKIDGKNVVVLQAPESEAGVTIDSVSYGEGVTARISGRGRPGAEVSLFIRPAAGGEYKLLFRTQVGADGQWSGTVRDEIPEGVSYAVRAVLGRDAGAAGVEVPFLRERPSFEVKDGEVIVHKGNSLWRIARRVYGKGIRFHLIYSANLGKIDDPNLIYPGQVLKLPTAEGQ